MTGGNAASAQLSVLSLFSGIGGLDLGLERAGMTVVGQVEKDPWCRRVLAKHWPEVPQHDDVHTCVEWWGGRGRPDVVAGGFPCQPDSIAGKQLGRDDERWLWPEMASVLRDLRPRYAILENPAGILSRRGGIRDVLGDLATLGYDCEWDCVPAAAFGAPHLRWRWLAVAYPHRECLREQPVTEPRCRGAALVAVDGPQRPAAHADREGQLQPGRIFRQEWRWAGDRRAEDDADPAGEGRSAWRADTGGEGAAGGQQQDGVELAGGAWWAVEPELARVVYGVPDRVDRTTGLGNAVVPQVAEYVGRCVVEHARRAA